MMESMANGGFGNNPSIRPMMNRRLFIKRLISQMGVVMTMRAHPLFPQTGSSPSGSWIGGLHYRPLNGASLRDLAQRKRHHGPDGLFLNPMGAKNHRNLFQLLNWKLLQTNPYKKYFSEEPVKQIRIDWEEVTRHKGVSVTFLKHAGVIIKDGDTRLCVDPIFEDISFIIKDFTPITPDSLKAPPMNHVLITHGHYDHLDRKSLSSFSKETHVISPPGYRNLFSSLGLNRSTSLDWYEAYDDGATEITCLPCNHWTMRNPLEGPNRALWGAFLIRTKSGMTIFISGDSAYFDGFEQIGSEYDIDLAIFNIGAYEPRWFMAPSHMNPSEVVTAFQEIKAKKLMAVHWGTFRLGDEPVHFPPLHLKEELKKRGIADCLIDLGHGETRLLS